MTPRTFALLATAAAALAGCSDEAGAARACEAGERTVVTPPARGATYHGAFPFLGNSEDRVTRARIEDYERLTGRELAWVYVSDNWFAGIRFPTRSVAAIRATGAVPFIRLMPRSTWREGARDPRYSMQSILEGTHDDDLRAWARAAARVRGPVLVEFGAEVNGSWFPWSGAWNGGAATARYGDPRWPDGPERYRDAYRHVVREFRAAGARNVTWVWHVDAAPDPDPADGAGSEWNAMRWYWPGDAYVDWIGLSAYGPQDGGEDAVGLDAGAADVVPFEKTFARGYREAAALSRRRPIALVEFAIANGEDRSDGGTNTRDEAAWADAAFDAIESGRYPRLRGVAWWHERWVEDDGRVVDLRVNSSPALLATYRRRVADTRYVSRVSRAHVTCR